MIAPPVPSNLLVAARQIRPTQPDALDQALAAGTLDASQLTALMCAAIEAHRADRLTQLIDAGGDPIAVPVVPSGAQPQTLAEWTLRHAPLPATTMVGLLLARRAPGTGPDEAAALAKAVWDQDWASAQLLLAFTASAQSLWRWANHAHAMPTTLFGQLLAKGADPSLEGYVAAFHAGSQQDDAKMRLLLERAPLREVLNALMEYRGVILGADAALDGWSVCCDDAQLVALAQLGDADAFPQAHHQMRIRAREQHLASQPAPARSTRPRA